MMIIEEFWNELHSNLSKVMSDEDVQFVESLIHSCRRDENLLYLNDDAFNRLQERNLQDAFNEVSNRMGIKWWHSTEAPD